MKKMLLVSLVLAVALMTTPVFADGFGVHGKLTVVGAAGNLTGAAGGAVVTESTYANDKNGGAISTVSGGGTGFAVNSSGNLSTATGSVGLQGSSYTATKGDQAGNSGTAIGGGIALNGWAVAGKLNVSGGAFGSF